MDGHFIATSIDYTWRGRRWKENMKNVDKDGKGNVVVITSFVMWIS
jgi:hypothetical protein